LNIVIEFRKLTDSYIDSSCNIEKYIQFKLFEPRDHFQDICICNYVNSHYIPEQSVGYIKFI